MLPTNLRSVVASLALAAVLLAPAAPALAQEPAAERERITVERIYTSAAFRVAELAELLWTRDGKRISFIQYNARTGSVDLWLEDIEGAERSRLIEGALLIPPGAEEPIRIESYEWSPDGSKLLIFGNTVREWRRRTLGFYYVYDLETEQLTPISDPDKGLQQYAKFSPDGSRVGFVRGHDLFVVDLETGEERRLTTSGSEVVINGTFDWVYEEELDLYDGWRWSPDGERIAFWQLNQRPIQPFYLLDYSDRYVELFPVRYPKAGTENSFVRIGVIELETGEITWIDAGNYEASNEEYYLARMDWAASSEELVIQRLSRSQKRIDVLLADASTGETRLLFSETDDDGWVDVDDHLTWIRGGEQFLWSSSRDGYNHLYLYNRDGTLVRQLAEGEWKMTDLEGVDEESGWVYFTAARPSPLVRNLYRVRLDGSGLERVSEGVGTHEIDLSPNAEYYIDVYSRAGVPPVTRLHRAGGELIRVLSGNDRVVPNLRAAGVNRPEFFTFETADGTELHGWMIKPPEFDPSEEYPVLMYVYGGPGSQTVTRGWGGVRYLWHQLLAQRGYIVASVDNRGTGARGEHFKEIVYLHLGKWESHDQVAAARYLASLPYVDEDRIGMWGWSYGGYLTALTVMRGGGLFDAAISVAPVAHWKLYDTLYTERFMLTPELNPEGYRESAPVNHVEGLEADFLLVHGTFDDNVHYQNSVWLADALIAAGKPFKFMMYPGRTHAIASGRARLHLFEMMTDWVLDRL